MREAFMYVAMLYACITGLIVCVVLIAALGIGTLYAGDGKR